MALIYSYPSLTPLSGLDTLLVSDATDDNRTTNVSIAELSEYIATYTLLEGNSDAADFVNGLKELITIDGQNVTIEGLASSSSVDALSESRAAFETKVTADQESAFASLKLEVDSEFKSYVNGKLSTYASSDAVTELISETTADYAIASDVTKLNAQFEFDAGGNITGTSGALVTAINAASANADQAFATQVNKLNAQFDIDGDGNITGLSSANIDSVKSVVASEGYASATSQAEIRVDVDDASATASDNVTAIATETLARVTKDEELVASIGNEEDGTGVYAAVRTVAEAVVTESEARAQEKTTLEAAIGSNTSAFEDYVLVKATEDAAQAIREEDMKTEFRGNNTAFQNFKNITYADAEQARSEEINTIRASASGAGALADTNAGEITETKRVVADIEGNIEATWKLDVTAGNRIAGMKLQADDVSSSVTFNADAFKVYNTSKGIAEAPFIIEDGEVVIQSASIKNVDFGAIDNVPDAMHATMIFADDADGTNPSTTQGSKNFVLHYNSKWIDGDPIPYTPFNRIEGPRGETGTTGTSFRLRGSVTSQDDLPSDTASVGDGYILGEDLFVYQGGTVWSNVGVIRGPVGLTGEPGEDGVGIDGLDGVDGDYVSYIYIVDNGDTPPSAPAYTEGSFNGTQEVVPTGWSDNPSADLDDVEWMSTRRYKNSKTVNNNGDTVSSWEPLQWSTPTRIYQRGETGNTPRKNFDYFDGVDGTYTSFVFRTTTEDTAPDKPTGGSYSSTTGETFPQYWYDNPTATAEDIEWVSKAVYQNTKTYDAAGNETSTWTQTGSGWSEPSKIFQKGDKGDTGPRGHVGPDGRSVTIKGTLENDEDLNSLDTSEHEAGDGYLIDGNLWVFDGTDWQDVGNIQGPTGPIGAIGPDGNPGIDGINGNDGIYTSFVYLAQDELPGVPVGGSFDGSVEVYPTSDDGQWSDNPTVSTQDTEWRSMIKYQNTKTVDDSGETRVYQSAWTQIGSWSQPVKSYQKGATGGVGLTGPSGASVVMRGKKDNQNELPVNTETHTNQIGDTYLIASEMHTWDGGEWKNLGSLKGDTGDRGPRGASVTGEKGDTGLDGYNGKDGVYTSFVYMVSDDQPGTPTGGTWNGASETYPSSTEGYWTDNPTVDDEDTEWRSSIKYLNQKTFEEVDGVRTQTSDTWSQLGGWSTPRKIFQKGDKGDTGSSVRLEFSADGTTGWSTQPSADTKWQRASTSAPNSNYWVAGTAIKFVPTAGVEYSEPSNGASVYLHIKYSDDGVRFTRNSAGVRDGETPGAWTGVYRTYSTDAPSSTPPEDPLTFSLYTWNKVQGDTPPPTPPLYQWVRYADNIHGTSNFSSTIGTRKFKGVAINKESQTASNSAADYTWSKFVPDEPTVKYMWVRYSDSATGSNYVSNSAGKDYVGFAYNKSTVNPPNGTPASDFDWSKVGGTTGETGRKVVTGTLFFQAKSKNVPSLDGAIGKSYFFNSNSVANEVKNAGWDVKTPEMTAGTASNNYWSVPFTAVQNENSNKGTLAFGTVTRAFAFNQVVTFDSLESDGTTEINGANIKTGAIQSQNYSNSSGDGYSSNGMKIDLEGSGSIHAEQFYINADGSTSFKGKHTAGELGNWEVENGVLKDSSDRIVLNPSSKAVELKDQSGNIKANVRASTTLKSTDVGFKSVVFSSTYSLKLNLKEQVTVPTTSSLTSRFESKYSRISNDITLAAGEKWEAKASEIPFANFDISNKWFNSEKNLIPSVSYSVTEPSSTVKNTYGYVDYADIFVSDQVHQAYVERTLQLQLLKRGSQSHHVVKTVTLSRAKKTGGLNFERWRKNAYSNNWYKFVNPVSYADTSYNIPQSEELVFDIAEDGDYYFRLKLITEAGNGKNISKSSGGTNSTFYGGTFDFDPPYNNYIFSALSGSDRNFKVYSSQNYAELSGGGLQVVTNYNKWVKLKRNEPGVNEAANVLIETKGGRVELENDKGEEALRVNADTKINGLLSVSGGVDNFNTNWSGIETGGFALKTDTYVEGSADNQYNLSNDGDGNLTYGLKVNGDSSFHLSPSSTKQNYRLPFEYGAQDDGEGLEYKQGQIITLINISSSNNANVLGIITANGAINPRVVVPGEALTLQFYKSNNRLQNWGSHNTYRGWFILSSYINAPNE